MILDRVVAGTLRVPSLPAAGAASARGTRSVPATSAARPRQVIVSCAASSRSRAWRWQSGCRARPMLEPRPARLNPVDPQSHAQDQRPGHPGDRRAEYRPLSGPCRANELPRQRHRPDRRGPRHRRDDHVPVAVEGRREPDQLARPRPAGPAVVLLGPAPLRQGAPGLEELAVEPDRLGRRLQPPQPRGRAFQRRQDPVHQDDPDAMGARQRARRVHLRDLDHAGERQRARAMPAQQPPARQDPISRARPGTAGGLHDRQAPPAVHLRRRPSLSRANLCGRSRTPARPGRTGRRPRTGPRWWTTAASAWA